MNCTRNAKRVLRLAAYAGAFGLATLVASSSSDASTIVFDSVATSTNDPAGTVSADGKTVTLTTPGSTVSFNVFAVIHNGDANQGNDGVIAVLGSIISGNGGLKGNITAANVAPFANNAFSSPGTQTDVHGDGDLDIGADPAWKTPTADSPDVFFHAGSSDGSPVFGTGTAGDLRQLIGTAVFTVAAGGSGTTTLQFIPHTSTTAGSSSSGRIQSWDTDGVFNSANGDGLGRISGVTGNQTGMIDLGTPITVSLGAVPEPGSLALASFAGLGLLARRRRA